MRVPVPERQARLVVESACALYQWEILGFGKEAVLAGFSQYLFARELTDRLIARHGIGSDPAEDLAYSRGG